MDGRPYRCSSSFTPKWPAAITVGCSLRIPPSRFSASHRPRVLIIPLYLSLRRFLVDILLLHYTFRLMRQHDLLQFPSAVKSAEGKELLEGGHVLVLLHDRARGLHGLLGMGPD